jgi:hypothetical protein
MSLRRPLPLILNLTATINPYSREVPTVGYWTSSTVVSLGVRGIPVHRLHPVQRSVRLLRVPSHQLRPRLISLSSGFRHSGLGSILIELRISHLAIVAEGCAPRNFLDAFHRSSDSIYCRNFRSESEWSAPIPAQYRLEAIRYVTRQSL